jgi:hypothetical protein
MQGGGLMGDFLVLGGWTLVCQSAACGERSEVRRDPARDLQRAPKACPLCRAGAQVTPFYEQPKIPKGGPE